MNNRPPKLKEIGCILMSPIYLPYLGYQTIKRPNDNQLTAEHWTFKVVQTRTMQSFGAIILLFGFSPSSIVLSLMISP